MKYLLPLFLLIFIPSRASHALDASYDGGEELKIVEKRYYQEEEIETYDDPLDMTYFSIYFNPPSRLFYTTQDGAGMIRTNGLTYKIDTNRLETSYTGKNIDPYLIFVGYITTNMRLYIDNRNTNQQYIKVIRTTGPIQVYIPEDPTQLPEIKFFHWTEIPF